MKRFYPRFAAPIFLLLFSCSLSHATIYNTVGDGLWSSPAVWNGGLVPPLPIGATDTVNVQHGVTGTATIMVLAGGQLNVNPNGYLDLTGFSLINFSNGGGASMGGVNIYGTLICSYIRNYGFSWIFIEPTGALFVFGDIDNLGDIYVSGILDITNGDFNHLAADIWIYAGGNVTISNGDFNNYSTIRNLFPNSCIRLLDGSFINQSGGIVAGTGGVTADLNVDNSANPLANWIGVTWCAGQNGLNVPPALEDCNGSPCTTPLQVEVASLEAIPTQTGSIRIEWATATEVNSERFLVERSYDLLEFEEVGQIAAAGESSTLTTYELLDEAHTGGLIHYRLTEIDQDGRFNVHSEIVNAFIELPEQPFILYPNPCAGQVQLQWDASDGGQAELVVLDAKGNVALKQSVTAGAMELNLSGYAAGMYQVILKTGSKMESRKLVLY